MKDPIPEPSVDSLLKKAFNDFYDYMYEPNIIKAAEEYTNKTIYKELKSQLYKLLVSKLPEKKKPTAGFDKNSYSYPDLGYNQALDQVTKTLTDLFGEEKV